MRPATASATGGRIPPSEIPAAEFPVPLHSVREGWMPRPSASDPTPPQRRRHWRPPSSATVPMRGSATRPSSACTRRAPRGARRNGAARRFKTPSTRRLTGGPPRGGRSRRGSCGCHSEGVGSPPILLVSLKGERHSEQRLSTGGELDVTEASRKTEFDTNSSTPLAWSRSRTRTHTRPHSGHLNMPPATHNGNTRARARLTSSARTWPCQHV